MRSVHLLPLGLCTAALLGCSANVVGSPGAGDAEVGSSSAAVIVVERTTTPADAYASAVARFVRMRSGAVDDDALRLVGATVDFPPLGTCAPAAAAATSARAVELMDVGTVALEAEGLRTNLQPRLLPDVVDLVSGVVYSTRASDAEGLPANGRYVLRASGSAGIELPSFDVPAFEVAATAPGEPGELLVAGQDVRGPVALGAGTPADLTWAAGAGDDFIYVDVGAAPSASGGVRCLFPDTGHATLAAGLLDNWADGALLVHRLHRETFRVKGIDSGEIRFDFARVVTYSRH